MNLDLTGILLEKSVNVYSMCGNVLYDQF